MEADFESLNKPLENMMQTIFWLLVGHALADFPLQGDTMAKQKNRNRKPDPGAIPPGQKFVPCWWIWLTAHGLIHGGVVALATGVWWLGACEAAAHWAIDFGKCENWYGPIFDQALHVLCKGAWWAVLVYAL